MHRSSLAPTIIAIAFGLPFAADFAAAQPPMKISDLATVEDLEAEVEARLAEIEPFLANDDAFAEQQKRLTQVASMLAVAAQGLADHDADSKLKPFAPDLREAALTMTRATTLAEASEGFQAARSAFAGVSAKQADPSADWGKLVKQRPIMEEMEVRMQTLQRALRRPKDPDKESRHATAVAIASLTTILDTHEVKEKDKLPEWDKLSRQMVEQLKQTADAVKSRKPMDAQAHFKAARATCVECHRQFKKEY